MIKKICWIRGPKIGGAGRIIQCGVDMLVGYVVHCKVMLGGVVAPVDLPGGSIKTELILGGS